MDMYQPRQRRADVGLSRQTAVAGAPLRVLIVTDAWFPQCNGVVRTLSSLGRQIEEMGHAVHFVTPEGRPTIACPTEPDIRLVRRPGRAVHEAIATFRPSAIHIATEGPLGFAARRHCLKTGMPFTTAFHTRFPEYVQARTGLPVGPGYALLRRFHAPAWAVMVATPSLRAVLAARGFRNVRASRRGVDTDLFRPRPEAHDALDLPRPIWLYVGRLAAEKNLPAFLSLDLGGTKLVVGDGPQRAALARAFPDAVFLGRQEGEALARCYAASDVFVFPSRTDSFGLVLIEALACGLPVAAFPVTGPRDVLDGAAVGCLDADLGRAARRALMIPREACHAYARRFSWQNAARLFLAQLAPSRAEGGTSPL
jgi:glycosyltransferase involved in cell wall biosynthesis